MATKRVKLKKIRCKLSEIMSDRGLTQQALSEATGVSRESLRKLQVNESDLMSRRVINALVNYLEVDVCELFELVEE